MIRDTCEWCPLQRINSVSGCLFEFQTTPHLGQPVQRLDLQPIVPATMPAVMVTSKSIIDRIIYRTTIKIPNLLHAENCIPTQKNLYASIDDLEKRWNIHLVSYDTYTRSVTTSCNGQLSFCSWSFTIVDEFHWFNTTNNVGWQIRMKSTIGFKLWVTAMPGFCWLFDRCYQLMMLISGAPEDWEDDTVIEMHSAETQCSAEWILMHGIEPEDEYSQQDSVHHTIQSAKPWMIRTWSEWNLPKWKPLIQIPKEYEHLIDPESTEEKHAMLKIIVERDTSQDASQAWMIHRSQPAWVLFVFANTEDGIKHSWQ